MGEQGNFSRAAPYIINRNSHSNKYSSICNNSHMNTYPKGNTPHFNGYFSLTQKSTATHITVYAASVTYYRQHNSKLLIKKKQIKISGSDIIPTIPGGLSRSLPQDEGPIKIRRITLSQDQRK